MSTPSPAESRPRALVTGGNGNLGEAVARLLQRADYEVHITVQDQRTRAEFAYGMIQADIHVHVVDLTDPPAVAKLAADIGGSLDALVATVGGFAGGPFAAMDPAVFDQQYSLNLKTTMLTLHAMYPLLKASSQGSSVVLVGSRPAMSSGPGTAVSAAMKAAVIHLTKSLAKEWKPDNITVNAVAPGVMDTPQNRRDIPDGDPAGWPTPGQVAVVVAFLLSGDGAIVSGATVPVFGRS